MLINEFLNIIQSTPNNSTFLENQKKFELAEGGGGGEGRTRGLEGYGRTGYGKREKQPEIRTEMGWGMNETC